MAHPNPQTNDRIYLDVEDKRLECSRKLLMNNSDYFRAMLGGNNFVESRQSIIKINDVNAYSVELIIKILTHSDYCVDSNSIYNVIHAASMLQFIEIKEKCISRVRTMLSVHNCLHIWFFAEELAIQNLYLEAKLTSLLEFMQIKELESFLRLTLLELINYVGNTYLYCINETVIFEAIITWYKHNSKEEIKSPETEIRLLKCVNYLGVPSEEDFNQMIEKAKSVFLQETIQLLENLKLKQFNRIFDTKFDNLINSLLAAKRRNCLGSPAVLTETESSTNSASANKFKKSFNNLVDQTDYGLNIHYFVKGETHFQMAARTIWNINEAYKPLRGYRMLAHRDNIYILGGEGGLGSGFWNLDVVCINLTQSAIRDLSSLPFTRRHFEACVSDDYLYVVGGTGRFRVIQNNFYWLNLSTMKWHPEVGLPCSGLQIKCCEFQKSIFILNIKANSYSEGYIYCHTREKWETYVICDEKELLPMQYSEALCLFTDRNVIYVKDETNLVELQFIDRILTVVKQTELQPYIEATDISQSAAIICDQVVYSLYKHLEDQKITFTAFNIDTKTVLRYENVVSDCSINNSLNIFNVFHPYLVEKNTLINEI